MTGQPGALSVTAEGLAALHAEIGRLVHVNFEKDAQIDRLTHLLSSLNERYGPKDDEQSDDAVADPDAGTGG